MADGAAPRRQPRRAGQPRPAVPAPPQGNQRAARTGARSNGEFLAEYPSTLAQIRHIVEVEAPWVKESDYPLLSVFAAELVVFRRAAEALAGLSATAFAKKQAAQRTQIRRAKLLSELGGQLGLSPAGRYKLGLVSAKTAAIRVNPVRNEERAREVARLLAQSGAIPPTIDAEAIDSPTTAPAPEATPPAAQPVGTPPEPPPVARSRLADEPLAEPRFASMIPVAEAARRAKAKPVPGRVDVYPRGT